MITNEEVGVFSYLHYKGSIAGIVWIPEGYGGHVPIAKINSVYYSEIEKNPNFDEFKYYVYMIRKIKKIVKDKGFKEFHLVDFHLFPLYNKRKEIRNSFLNWKFLRELQVDGLEKVMYLIKNIDHGFQGTYFYKKIYDRLRGLK